MFYGQNCYWIFWQLALLVCLCPLRVQANNSKEDVLIKKWLNTGREGGVLNGYGDYGNQMYMGGTPLFDEKKGEHRNLFEYIRSRHPKDREDKRPWEHPSHDWFPKLNAGSYIIVFRKDLEPQQVESLVDRLSQNHGFKPKSVYKYTIKGFAATLNDSQLAKVVLLAEVDYFEGDGQVTGYAKSHSKYGAVAAEYPAVGARSQSYPKVGSRRIQAGNVEPEKVQASSAVLVPSADIAGRLEVLLTGVPELPVRIQEARVCRPEEEVNCFVSPCQMATCERHPEALCRDNYCGGCHADFILEGVKVHCDAAPAKGDVGMFSEKLNFIQNERWLKTFPPQGSFTIDAERQEETVSFLRKFGYEVEVKGSPQQKEL